MTLIRTLLRTTSFWVSLWIFWMGVIFAFSHMPGSPVWYEPSFSYILERKGAHIVEYAVLTLLSLQVFSLLFPKESLSRILWLAFTWTFFYAATDELHQFFTPYRGAKIADVAIDIFGGLLVIIPVAIFLYFRKPSHKHLSGNNKKVLP